MEKEKKFYPYYFFEIIVLIVLTVEITIILSVLFPIPIGRTVDLTAQFSPRPEWYFLFLYQLTKYFPGAWAFIGVWLLPGAALAIIFLAPFLDRGEDPSLRKRIFSLIVAVFILASTAVLTFLALWEG